MPNNFLSPTPLKIAQNGTIGEARARSFLLNRFWVLERSVDIYGADFLIQRRLTDRTRLDLQRMGIVQAKYVQDGKTGIKIPQHYVDGDRGNPRGEFFLLICTGTEDTERMFLLTAQDIREDFNFTTGTGMGTGEYRVRAGKIIDSKNRQVISRAQSLDKMEQSLRLVGINENRNYLAVHGFVRPDSGHIDPDLTESISNRYGDLPQEFYKVKKYAENILDTVGQVSEALEQMVRTTDPTEFFKVYEDELTDYIDASGRIIVGTSDDIWNEDLSITVNELREYRNKLAGRGLLTAFPAFLHEVSLEIKAFFERELTGATPEPCVHVRIEFDLDSLDIKNISVKLEIRQCDGQPLPSLDPERLDKRVSILASSDGVIEACHSGSYLYSRHPLTRVASEYNAAHIVRLVQGFLHQQLFGDDEGLL